MEKNNKLIAEFMGKPYKQEFLEKGVGGVFEEVVLYEDLQYHNSWNWLMPVANEIIKSRDEQNADWDLTDLKYSLQTTNIELVYKAVVDFIKNQND